MAYQYITSYDSPNYTSGRPYGIHGITIHHWGNDGQSFETVTRYLCRPDGDSSAHYVVEAGRVACIVAPGNRAWHAGDGVGRGTGGATTIGIECRPEMSDGDFETVAELIADLWDTYGVLPLYPHKRWTATACPGRWTHRLGDLARRAHAIRRARGAGKNAIKGAGEVASTIRLAVDGEIGRTSIKLAQKLYHTPVDGEIWDQPAELREHLPALDFPGGGLVFGSGDDGSSLVRALQTTLNRGGFNAGQVDGVFGPGTVRALQRALGVAADGYLGYDSAVAWQSWMNEEARKRGITSL